jgi:hypothetical protein
MLAVLNLNSYDNPNPETLIESGDVSALLFRTTFASILPPDVGTKRMVSMNDLLGGIVADVGRALNALTDDDMLLIFRVSLPSFDIVTTVSLY